MKKFTLLFVFLALANWSLSAQCIRTYSGPNVASNNLGLLQTIESCAYTTTDFVTVTNLLVGNEYVFTSTSGTTHKYIAVTDLNNVVITQGSSPLTVESITNTAVRLHLSDDALCGGTPTCHIVTVQAFLQCPLPVDLVIEDLGTTSANFSWEPVGSETSWDIVLLPATSAAPTASATDFVTITNNPIFQTTSLTPSTSYKFYYRAACSETEKSPWNSSDAFTTLCESVSYFSQNFDASTTMPSCWSKVGTEGTANVQNSSSAASLPNNLYMSMDFTTNAKPVVLMPNIIDSDAGTHRLKFKVRGDFSADGSVEFGYLIDPANASSFVSLQTYNATSATVYNEYIYEAGTDIETGNLAFRATGSVVLDDVIWELMPLCDDVTNVNVVSFSSNAAVLSYSSTNDVEVVYSNATNANPNELTPIAAQNESIALSSLESSSTYKVWVRSVCNATENGAWVGPKTFKTNCTPVSSFSQNFDAGTTFPSCWKKVGTTGNAYIQSANGTTSTPNALNMSSYTNNLGVVALPAVSNAAAGTNRLKFSARGVNVAGSIIEVGYLTNPDNASSFVQLTSFTTTSASAFQSFIYVPDADTVLSETLAFRIAETPGSAVYFDDVIWESNPNCGDVASVQTTGVTNNSAAVSWTASSSAETNWQVAYGIGITDPANATIADVTSAPNTTLTGLSDASNYTIWVRSKCGDAEFGAWIGPKSILTLCNPVTEIMENFDAATTLPVCWKQVGSGSFFIQTDGDLHRMYLSAVTIALPQVSNAAANTHKLSFKARAAYDVGGVIEVGYLQDLDDATSFVALDTFIPTSTTEFNVFNAYLGTAPQSPYLAFRHTGIPYGAVLIDDVSWELLPACQDVTSIATDLITDTSASVAWAAGTASNWQIVLGQSTDNDLSSLTPIDVATPSYAFTALTEATTYKYWVRSNCGNGEFGAWIGPKTFRTKCEAIADFPWEESFEDVTIPALPSCWTKENGDYSTSNDSYLFEPYSGLNYLKNNANAVNEYIWTPGFTLQANHSYDFSTLVRGDGYDNWTVKMAYNTYASSQGATVMGDTFVVNGNGNVSTSMNYEEMKRTFVPTQDGTYYFALVVNENAAGYPYAIAFDDVALIDNGMLSTPGFETNNFTVYPNPVKNWLNISYTQNITSVEVFNLLGQNVITNTTNTTTKTQVDMSALAAGTYLVKVNTENGTKTMKVIKE